jgi:hypothetical protein
MTVLFALLLAMALGVFSVLSLLQAVKLHRLYVAKPHRGINGIVFWAMTGGGAALGALLVVFFTFNPPPPSFGRL